MPSTTTMARAFLLAGLVAADPLTVLDVCRDAKPGVPSCTVTAQHQSVSTCYPTATACKTWTHGDKSGTDCSTKYSYSSWAYVSTVIPCGYDGKSISSCTVTKTDQVVPCSASASTITSVVPVHTKFPAKNATDTNPIVEYSTSYKTVSKEWSAPYNKLGPLAIPGYEGSGLCKECSDDKEGSRSQHYDVTQCENDGDKSPSCNRFPENRVSSKSVPGKSTPVSAVNSVKTSVKSAGTYKFTFTNTAPAATITHNGQKITIPPRPWFHYETRTARGPTKFDFTTRVTKTVYVHAPYKTSTGANKTPVDPETALHHWGNWNPPAPTSGPQGRPNGPGAKPAGKPFVIPANSGSGSKYSNVHDQYVGFPNNGDDASVVHGQGNAAKFHFDSEGNLMFGDKYVSPSTNAGYLVFELKPNKPRPGSPKFHVDEDGSFTLPGAGFCSTGNTFFITYGSAPSGCKPVNCNLNEGKTSTTTAAAQTTKGDDEYHWGNWKPSETSSWITSTSSKPDAISTTYTTSSTSSGYGPSSTTYTSSTTSSTTSATTSTTTTTTTTTTTKTTTTTSSESTTTTTSYDPSADLDYPEPTPRPHMRKRGGVLHARQVWE